MLGKLRNRGNIVTVRWGSSVATQYVCVRERESERESAYKAQLDSTEMRSGNGTDFKAAPTGVRVIAWLLDVHSRASGTVCLRVRLIAHKVWEAGRRSSRPV